MFRLSEEDERRVKMGRLLEWEERELLKIISMKGPMARYVRALTKPGYRPSRVFYPKSERPRGASGAQTLHFQAKTAVRRHQKRVPKGRTFMVPTTRKYARPQGAKGHKNLRSSSGDPRVYSVHKGKEIPPGFMAVAASDIQGQVKGVRPGLVGRFAADYLLRAGAVEYVGGSPSIVHSPEADTRHLWSSIERRESRRDARLQHRIIAELPYEQEIGPAGRLDIISNFVRVFADDALPFLAVVHRPDLQGDARNYHAHIVWHGRPYEALPDGGFRFAEKKVDWIEQRDLIIQLKTQWCQLINEAYEKKKIDRKFTPHGFREMGYEKDPDVHLGTVASALSRKAEDLEPNPNALPKPRDHAAWELAHNAMQNLHLGAEFASAFARFKKLKQQGEQRATAEEALLEDAIKFKQKSEEDFRLIEILNYRRNKMFQIISNDVKQRFQDHEINPFPSEREAYQFTQGLRDNIEKAIFVRKSSDIYLHYVSKHIDEGAHRVINEMKRLKKEYDNRDFYWRNNLECNLNHAFQDPERMLGLDPRYNTRFTLRDRLTEHAWRERMLNHLTETAADQTAAQKRFFNALSEYHHWSRTKAMIDSISARIEALNLPENTPRSQRRRRDTSFGL
ncbi:MobA/MobL family protein [Yunchengibacter salinarum]|uniref:MobA/MobL family protein n=1 Tax=Yunchengibacter salinarum TaxID=3133399 RepID=UPI0035B6A08B